MILVEFLACWFFVFLTAVLGRPLAASPLERIHLEASDGDMVSVFTIVPGEGETFAVYHSASGQVLVPPCPPSVVALLHPERLQVAAERHEFRGARLATFGKTGQGKILLPLDLPGYAERIPTTNKKESKRPVFMLVTVQMGWELQKLLRAGDGGRAAHNYLRARWDEAKARRDYPSEEAVEALALPPERSYFDAQAASWLLRKAARAEHSRLFAREEAAWLFRRLQESKAYQKYMADERQFPQSRRLIQSFAERRAFDDAPSDPGPKKRIIENMMRVADFMRALAHPAVSNLRSDGARLAAAWFAAQFAHFWRTDSLYPGSYYEEALEMFQGLERLSSQERQAAEAVWERLIS